MKLINLLYCICYLCVGWVSASSAALNVSVLGGEIPTAAIQAFEHQSGVHINLSTFDSNEALTAKLRFTADYDVLVFSSYIVPLLQRLALIQPLDRQKISRLKELNPILYQKEFEDYFVPFGWGVTGIFYHPQSPFHPTQWRDLWSKAYRHRLVLLDDMREIFSIALIVLGYSPNDTNPQHLQEAFEKLMLLRPNIRLFVANRVQSLVVDEDVVVGMSWNNDIFKAQQEGSKVCFVYPKDGFVIWIDGFAISKHTKQLSEAQQFINFMIQPAVAKSVLLEKGLVPSNTRVKALLTLELQKNSLIDPPPSQLARGVIQQALPPAALKQMTALWQRFKLSM